ncbi:MAG: hypothetical protein Q8O76_04390, partial [Chloroflexota bacterium]|nr:hypothetical protein [Chloroflexota bacterium]
MTARGGQTLTWDVENRMTGAGSATSEYDGDGFRVKKTEDDETIIYVNQYYEKNLDTEVVTLYYYLGGKLVAYKEGANLRYVHQDHLTGTSLTTAASGNKVDQIKYMPYGGTRSGDVTSTEMKFTG